MFSGSNTSCTRLCATRLPLPWAQVLILTEVGRGPSPSMKVGCKLGTVHEDEATSVPPWIARRGPLTGFHIVIPPDGRRGVLAGTSLETPSVGSFTRYFFLGQPN